MGRIRNNKKITVIKVQFYNYCIIIVPLGNEPRPLCRNVYYFLTESKWKEYKVISFSTDTVEVK